MAVIIVFMYCLDFLNTVTNHDPLPGSELALRLLRQLPFGICVAVELTVCIVHAVAAAHWHSNWRLLFEYTSRWANRMVRVR